MTNYDGGDEDKQYNNATFSYKTNYNDDGDEDKQYNNPTFSKMSLFTLLL
jgi:hypothetical protein